MLTARTLGQRDGGGYGWSSVPYDSGARRSRPFGIVSYMEDKTRRRRWLTPKKLLLLIPLLLLFLAYALYVTLPRIQHGIKTIFSSAATEVKEPQVDSHRVFALIYLNNGCKGESAVIDGATGRVSRAGRKPALDDLSVQKKVVVFNLCDISFVHGSGSKVLATDQVLCMVGRGASSLRGVQAPCAGVSLNLNPKPSSSGCVKGGAPTETPVGQKGVRCHVSVV